MPADDPLLAVARAILEGTDVDWAVAETLADGPRGPLLLAGLRSLHQVAAAFRGLEGAHSAAGLRTWGSFTLEERVGAGAFAEIFRAWDPRLQRQVALKLLRPEGSEAEALAEATLREGRVLARVRHPNIVSVHGVERNGDQVGLTMEFVHGQTLAALLRERGSFGPREAALVGIDLCRALAALHALGLTHGDVKAQNVMREEGGRVVLMDPGVGMRGTPLYMAPEVLAGQSSPNASADLYSAGVLLFHLVTTQYPVWGPTVAELRLCHARGERRRLRDVRADLPVAFVRAVEHALERRPERRCASAGALEAALVEALDAAPAAAVRARVSKRLVAAGVLVAAAVVMFALATAYGRRARGVQSAPTPPVGVAQPLEPAEAGPPRGGPSLAVDMPVVEGQPAPGSAPTTTELLDVRLAGIAAKAGHSKELWRRYDEGCRGKSTSGARGVQEPFTADNETTLECRSLRADAERLDGEVRRELDETENAARLGGVGPGTVRTLRQKHGI